MRCFKVGLLVAFIALCFEPTIIGVQGSTVLGSTENPASNINPGLPLEPSQAHAESAIQSSTTASGLPDNLRKDNIHLSWIWVFAGALTIVGFSMIFKNNPNISMANIVLFIAALLWFDGFILFYNFIVSLRDTFNPNAPLDPKLAIPTVLRIVGAFFLTLQPFTALTSQTKDDPGFMFGNFLGALFLHLANMASSGFLFQDPNYGPSHPNTIGMIILQLGTWMLIAFNFPEWGRMFPNKSPKNNDHKANEVEEKDDEEDGEEEEEEEEAVAKPKGSAKGSDGKPKGSAKGSDLKPKGSDEKPIGSFVETAKNPRTLALGGAIALTLGSLIFLNEAYKG